MNSQSTGEYSLEGSRSWMQSYDQLEQRALDFLWSEAKERGVATPGGTVLQLDLAAQDIATYLAMSRAEATRALNGLKRKGIIKMEGSTLTLLQKS